VTEVSSYASPRSHSLDGLRGYAALSVAFFHTITALDYSQVQRIEWTTLWHIPGAYGRLNKLVLALLNGETPVVIFFVLSGLVLFKSLDRSKQNAASTGWAFLVRRFIRIYPALIACLIFAWLMLNLTTRSIPLSDFWDNSALLAFKVNGATWTLQVEMLAAPLILIAYLGYRYFQEAGLLLVLLAMWVVFTYLPAPEVFNPTKWVWFCFALGILIPTKIGKFVVSLAPRHSWIFALVVMLFARHLIPDVGLSFTVHRCAAALLVALIFYGKTKALDTFFTLPISKFLGDISYSFYLYHALVMEFVTSHVLKLAPWTAQHPIEVGIPLGVLVAVVTIPLAMISYRWIEKPSITLGYRLTTARGVASSGQPSNREIDIGAEQNNAGSINAPRAAVSTN
jgi:peptidoglycan/LPS O-acetylase OafA/YrhL